MGPVGAGGVMRRSSWRAPGYDLHCAGWAIRSSEGRVLGRVLVRWSGVLARD
jgi:hypothetical protein